MIFGDQLLHGRINVINFLTADHSCYRPERQTTRVEDQGLSTSFTAHSSGHFRPLDVQQQRGRSTMMEFAAPLPQPSQTSGMTPSYVQRANTFLERQRSVFTSGHPHPFLSNTILQGGSGRMLFEYGYPTYTVLSCVPFITAC